ncbi:MAG TPA: hypothetical protein VMM77_07960 [Gemmatimonadaceae bacterium]|nr:hypothetical protein [Gemmatimonadaceae bacterium]
MHDALRGVKEKSMKKATEKPDPDEMRDEYDLRGGVRGKFYEEYQRGTNVILLDSDVAAVFRGSAVVNQALREYLEEHGSPPEIEHAR